MDDDRRAVALPRHHATPHVGRRGFLTRMGHMAALGPLAAGPLGGLLSPGGRTETAIRAGSDVQRVAQPSQLETLVLGSVQDAGLPQVGCYSERCMAGRELEPPRFVASLALVEPEDERFFLVDATPDITRQIDLIDHPAFRERAMARRPFDGIFLTHAHIGHYTGLAVLGNEGLGMAETPVYCTRAMADFLSEHAPWSFLVDQGRIVPTPLALDHWHRIDERLSVQLLKVPHRDEFADTVAFHFQGPARSLLYLPDINAWRLWDRDLVEVTRSVDVALLDGSFYSADEVPGRPVEDIPHPLIPQTMDLLQGLVDEGVTEVVFTHLNNSNPALDEGGPAQAEIARRGYSIAREGLRFGL